LSIPNTWADGSSLVENRRQEGEEARHLEEKVYKEKKGEGRRESSGALIRDSMLRRGAGEESIRKEEKR